MNELVLAAEDNALLRSSLLDGQNERCAILFVNEVKSNESLRLLVREVQIPEPDDYTVSGPLKAELSPHIVARATKRARLGGLGLVFAHSHPGHEPPVFSDVDARGEQLLAEFLSRRHPAVVHAALVVSEGGSRARLLASGENIRVVSVGSTRDVLFETEARAANAIMFDRQIRVLGSRAQKILGSLRVAVVGLGGTGSLVSQQLVHLGVRAFTLIDADVIEVTNLNRVANATTSDIGRPKVDIAAEYIDAFAGGAFVEPVRGDVMEAAVARRLLTADLIFGCTDSHGSRAVLQQVAYQYLIPYIDLGVIIAARKAQISHIYGRVQLLAPGLGCFTCGGLLDPNEVRRDMMTAFERQADPYAPGSEEPAPAVMSLNATAASLAITMMLAIFAGFPSTARHLLYNAITSTLRSVRTDPKPNCYICSRSGAFARGDSWPLFARSG